MNSPLVAIVTGAILGPLVLYEASRSGSSIDLTGLSIPPTAQIRPAKLSLTDKATITALGTTVGNEYRSCDILINNAGIYYFQENITATKCQETLDVDYRGTFDGGRIVNASSQSGQLKSFHPRLQTRFLKPDLTFAELDILVGEYSRLAEQHNEIASGWPPLQALNAATRILARNNPDLLINCCCPGWVGTPLGAQAGQPPKFVQEGAGVPLRLAVGDIGQVSGRYWANDSVASTGHGKVSDW
ncbi:Short-chain dehydrogenase/reductase SDR [Penicillium sp. IBT 35674x]|nr:Short-chain dehydrogenase/reductase SDR [Penicillium sp. IBT 35674x]